MSHSSSMGNYRPGKKMQPRVQQMLHCGTWKMKGIHGVEIVTSEKGNVVSNYLEVASIFKCINVHTYILGCTYLYVLIYPSNEYYIIHQ